MEERYYWLGFSAVPGIGPVRFANLLQHFGSAKDAWNAKVGEVEKVVRSRKLSIEFENFRNLFSIEEYKKKLHDKKVWFVCLNEKEYPTLLKQIPNPPFVLYGKGEREFLRSAQNDNPKIGIVGTRKVTSYGRQVTEQLTAELVQAGCVIVSGLALGVDAIAHKTTIENNGKTIAVLGSGADICYPLANQTIYNSIISGNGCVVSEYPLGMTPSAGSFPSRNRIIAGLSQAVLVTEGAEDSGSLITASNALEFHRKVFAVPGPITSSLSKGPLQLLKKGAKMVTSGEDVLQELSLTSRKSRESRLKVVRGETKEEQKIIDLLQNESLFLDEIIKKTSFSSSQISSVLTMLEIKGFVKAETDGKFSIHS